MIPAQAREQHQRKTHQQNFRKTHDSSCQDFRGERRACLAPARNMSAAYGLLLFRYREEEIWLEFRTDARVAVALERMF
jgi:hypothetical protein